MSVVRQFWFARCVCFLELLFQIPQTWWLKPTEMNSLTVLEARSPKGSIGRTVPFPSPRDHDPHDPTSMAQVLPGFPIQISKSRKVVGQPGNGLISGEVSFSESVPQGCGAVQGRGGNTASQAYSFRPL